MGKAAAELSISQPAISKAIADLEYALGVRLLDRSQHGVEPTVYGRALLDGGLNAFDEIKQAVRHVEFLSDPAAGEVRLGSSVIIGMSLVSAIVHRISRKHPRVSVHLLAAEAAMIYRAIEERQIEVALVGLFGPATKENMNAEILYDDPFVVAAGAQNPWCRRHRIKLADLMEEPWALPPRDSPTGAIVVEVFRARGLDLPRAKLVSSSIPARNAMLAGGFLTMLPASVLKFPGGNEEIKALPVDIPKVGRPIGIVTLKNRTLSPVAQLVIDAAREVAKSISGRAKR
jgi:DNA-binding transcriptional LysR family regulator